MSLVPYAEPSAFSKGFYSPYYNESHKKFKLAVRDWIQKNVIVINLDLSSCWWMGRELNLT